MTIVEDVSDQGMGMKVMWGGGVDEGVKTKLGPGESKLVYFSLVS